MDDSFASQSLASRSFASQYSTASDGTVDSEPEAPLAGTLVIVIMRAKNLYNRRVISKQNPFCTVRVASHSARTKAILRGGQSPTWDHEVRFKLSSEDNNQILKVGVFDQDGSGADIIGETRVSLHSAYVAPVQEGFDAWHPIKYNGKYVGEVYLEMTWYPCKKSRRHRRSAVGSTGIHSSHHSRMESPTRSPSPDIGPGVTPPRASNNALRGRPLPPLPQQVFYQHPVHSAPLLPPDVTSMINTGETPASDTSPPLPPPHTKRSSVPSIATPDLGIDPQMSMHSPIQGQDDISRQINDRYGASMFERIRPQP